MDLYALVMHFIGRALGLCAKMMFFYLLTLQILSVGIGVIFLQPRRVFYYSAAELINNVVRLRTIRNVLPFHT